MILVQRSSKPGSPFRPEEVTLMLITKSRATLYARVQRQNPYEQHQGEPDAPYFRRSLGPERSACGSTVPFSVMPTRTEHGSKVRDSQNRAELLQPFPILKQLVK